MASPVSITMARRPPAFSGNLRISVMMPSITGCLSKSASTSERVLYLRSLGIRLPPNEIAGCGREQNHFRTVKADLKGIIRVGVDDYHDRTDGTGQCEHRARALIVGHATIGDRGCPAKPANRIFLRIPGHHLVNQLAEPSARRGEHAS